MPFVLGPAAPFKCSRICRTLIIYLPFAASLSIISIVQPNSLGNYLFREDHLLPTACLLEYKLESSSD